MTIQTNTDNYISPFLLSPYLNWQYWLEVMDLEIGQETKNTDRIPNELRTECNRSQTDTMNEL